MTRPVVLLLAWSAVVAAVACQLSSDAPRGQDKPARPSTVARTTVSAPIDVASIATRFHFAFRREQDGRLVAGHASHVVHADARGFSLAPIDSPRPGGAPAAAPSSAPLSLDAASISRGATSVAAAAGEARIDADGSLAIDRSAVLHERLTNGEHGVEQSWTFDAAPDGAGDLVLRMPAHGEPFVARTESGLHFADRATGRGVVYGPAAWIDARGAKTDVASAFDGAAIVLRVPAAVVAASSYPATLDPNVGPEHEVDQPIFASYGPGVNAAPAIDIEGSQYFVVWADDRTTLNNGIFGVHVGQNGAPVESVPITISPGFPGNATSPAYDSRSVVAVAYDGANHLVTYVDQRNGHAAISARRVSAAGAVLDAAPIDISPLMNADALEPSVVFDGSEYLVAWDDGRNAPASTSDVFLTRVTPGGSVLNASSIKVSGAAGNNVGAKIAFGGGGHAYVVWSHDETATLSSSIDGALVATNGIVLGTDILLSQATNFDAFFLPGVAGWGGGFLVSYCDSLIGGFLPGPSCTVRAVPVGADGQPMAGAPRTGLFPLENPSLVNGVYMYSTPSPAFDGTNFVLVYDSPGRLNAQSITTAGALLGTSTFLSLADDEQSAPGGAVVASSASGTMVVQHTVVGMTADAVVSVPVTLDAEGGAAFGAVTPLSQAANFEFQGGLAYDGTTSSLVTWVDTRNAPGSAAYYGVILDANGLGVGGADGGIDAGYALADAFPIATNPGNGGPVRAASDGTAYLVAYNTQSSGCSSGVGVKRVSTQGQIIGDTAGTFGAVFTCTGAPPQLDVTWDGAAFLVVYTNAGSSQVYGTHVTRTSAGAPSPVESGPVLLSNTANDVDPRVASEANGMSFILWRDATNNLVGRFVGDPLTLPDGGQPAPLQIAANATGEALVYDTLGTSYRLAWIAQSGATPPTLSFASATSGAGLGTPAAIAAAPFPQAAPAIGFNGKDSLVVWTDQRTALGQLDIYGARLDLTGALLDPAGFPIAADPILPEAAPTAVGNGSGSTLVTYMKYTGDRGIIRLHSRVVTDVTNEGLGASCTTGGDCSSGFCVDHVCCNSGCSGSALQRCAVCAATLGATADGTCTVLPLGRVCRASSGDCDLTERCDGTNPICPVDTPAMDGTLCSFGVCMAGSCVATTDGGGPIDAGVDTGVDAGADAASDAAADASGDAAAEAGGDAAAGVDAGVDAGARDAGVDAGHDAGRDAPAAVDAGEDSGPPIVVIDAAPPGTSADASFDTFPPASGGCSCRTASGDAGGGAPAWLGASLLALGVVGRRRRRSR